MAELDMVVVRMKAENHQRSHGCDCFEFKMVGNSQGRRS